MRAKIKEELANFMKFCFFPVFLAFTDIVVAWSFFEKSYIVWSISTLLPIFGPFICQLIQFLDPKKTWPEKMTNCLLSFPLVPLVKPFWSVHIEKDFDLFQ